MSDDFWKVLAGVGVAFIFIVGMVSSSMNDTKERKQIEERYRENAQYVIENGDEDCTDDCSGHQAGYDWAGYNMVCDDEYDSGNSESFNEGVRAWARNYC